MKCPNCGKENENGMSYCMACGTKLSAETAQSRSYEYGYAYAPQAYPQMQVATVSAGSVPMAYAGQGYVQQGFAQQMVPGAAAGQMVYGNSKVSGLAIASLIFGILTVITSFILLGLTLINGLLAIGLGIPGIVSSRRRHNKASLIIAIIGTALGLFGVILVIVKIAKGVALFKSAAKTAASWLK